MRAAIRFAKLPDTHTDRIADWQDSSNYCGQTGYPVWSLVLDTRSVCYDGCKTQKCTTHRGKHDYDGVVASLHGTHCEDDMLSIVDDDGFIRPSAPERTAENRSGFHHHPDYSRAIWYAWPTSIGEHAVRIVIGIRVGCYNKIKAGYVTMHGCRCYHVEEIYITPCSVLPPGIGICKG